MADDSKSLPVPNESKIEIVTELEDKNESKERATGRSAVRSPARSPGQKLSLQLDAQTGAHNPPGLSPRSPCRPLSPHLGIVSKLYEEEVLINELTSTPAVDLEFIEQIQHKKHQLHSPAKSPEPNLTGRKQSTSNDITKE